MEKVSRFFLIFIKTAKSDGNAQKQQRQKQTIFFLKENDDDITKILLFLVRHLLPERMCKEI